MARVFPIFTTPDLPATVRFYRDLLGFRQAYQFPPEGEPEYVSLEFADGTQLAFAANPQEPAADRFEICIYVEAVDAAVERLRAAGAKVLQEPADQPWGERMAYVADPDGRRLHITAEAAG